MNIKDQIEELEYEILNLFIYGFYNLVHNEDGIFNLKFNLYLKSEKDKKKFNYLLTLDEKEFVYSFIREKSAFECLIEFPQKLGLEKFSVLYSYLKFQKIDKNKLIPNLIVMRPIDEGNYFSIYRLMIEYNDNEYCEMLSKLYRFSIKNLMDLLLILYCLKESISTYKDRAIVNRYNEIFNHYANLNSWFYGFKNSKLKEKIDKSRATRQREASKLNDKKYSLMLSILISEAKKNGKWENPSQAFYKNIELIEKNFKIFDTEILKYKINKLNEEIRDIDELLEGVEKINTLKAQVEYIEAALSKPHPYNVENIDLPYNTLDFDVVLIRRLKCEGSILEKILIKEYFLR